MYDAILKRKAFLDQIMEGLEDFQLATALRIFPAVFEPIFTAGSFESQDVIDILQPKVSMTGEEQAVFDFLQRFITDCNATGNDGMPRKTVIALLSLLQLCSELQQLLKYITGSPHIHGNKIVVDFIEQESVAMTVSTCAKTITLSTLVKEYDLFQKGLHTLINSCQFTMP